MAYEGQVVAERFEVLALAGEGGMGVVYRALDKITGQAAALKILRAETKPTHRERFAREARLLAKLEYPSIVRYLAHGYTTRNEPFLAMEWLEGQDLSSRLKRDGLTPAETLRVVRHAANALGAAHARGIIHRDIKPSNLFLVGGEVNRVKVLDFGIAHVQSAEAMTRTGASLGTPGYMAPEQARGSRDLGAAADVFSLGCVMFECLAGRPPFVGDSQMAVLAKILLEDAPRLGKVCTNPPQALEDLVARMLDKDPANRPRDGAAIAAALGDIGDIGSLELIPKGRDSAVTIGEQRLVCVVFASEVVVGSGATLREHSKPDTQPARMRYATPLPLQEVASSGTMPTTGESNRVLVALSSAVSSHGGRAEVLADGSVVVSVFGQGPATDQAARAARCALAVRAILPDASMALAIGRSAAGDRVRLGDLIDRATGMVGAKGATSMVDYVPEPDRMRPIRVDEVAAGLLDVRFAIEGDEGGLVLVGERDIAEPMRTLLGKQTPCVGRERELSTLRGIFAECADEPMAHIVVITGMPGIGKSRLRHELLHALAKEDVEVWIGSGDPMSVGAPFAMLAQALRRACGIVDGETLAVRHMKLHARVLRHVPPADAPRVVEFLGELLGAPFPDDDRGVAARSLASGDPAYGSWRMQLRAARQDPQLMGDQMLRACEDFVGAECAARPLLLLLEDLQWGDLPTVRFVDSIVRQLPDRPIMVLALARPEVDNQFPRLWAERRVVRIHLGELTKRASEKLIREALGTRIDDTTLTRLVDGAAGNAFYLEELIRSVAEGKGDRLPGSVLAMAQARIEGLEPEARQVLRAASIFGQVFWRNPVMQLLDGSTTQVEDWIDELVRRELIVERRDVRIGGESEYAFRHSLVREAAYAMLTEADRVRGHRFAGEWLEGRAPYNEVEAVLLAEHFERGGDPQRSTVWYRKAAEQALEGNDLVAAIDRADKAISCACAGLAPADRELIGAMRQLQAEAHLFRGDLELAVDRGRAALDRLPKSSGPWLVAAATMADACVRRLDVDKVMALCPALADTPATPATYRALTYAIAMAVQASLWHGDAEINAKLYARLDAVEADPAIDPAALAWIHSARSWRSMHDGDLAQCVVLDTKMVDCFTAIGDIRHACQQRGNLGYDELMIGAYTRAERALAETIATSARIGMHQITAQAKHNLGLALARQGRIDEARDVEKAALAMFVEQGNRRLDAYARCYLAEIEILAGNYQLAMQYARQAIELTPDLLSLRCQFHAKLSMAQLKAGQADRALAEAKTGIDLVTTHGRPEEGDADVWLAYAEALHATGSKDEARRVILEAEARLRTIAAKIVDTEGQRTYLAIPTNARTVTLADAWR